MIENNVLWVASFPKSGNTWINRILRNAGKPFGFPQGELGVYALLNRKEEPEACSAMIWPDQKSDSVVLKTHAAYRADGLPHHFPGLQLNSRAFIHIYRNPLDLLLSYINYTRIEYAQYLRRGKRVPEYQKSLFRDLLGFDKVFTYDDWLEQDLDAIPRRNLDHALNVFSRNDLTIETLAPMSGSWIEHTQSWLNARRDIPGTTLKYEDCVNDHEQITDIAEHFVFDRKAVRSAVESVDNALKNKRKNGPSDDKIFFNKMTAYYFPEYFSKARVADFMMQHEGILSQFGYASLLERYGN